jgi:GNAT superfamily N-acetyltransferase
METICVTYRFMNPGEEETVSDLIRQVFKKTVAPGFSSGGVHQFFRYIQPDSLTLRQLENHFLLVAQCGEMLVVIIEIRNDAHIALFFVDEHYQRRGIGKGLLKRALRICLTRRPKLKRITVNSSPNSVGAYQRFGFKPKKKEQLKDGIRYVPMKKRLK